jgi:hypothetical protein
VGEKGSGWGGKGGEGGYMVPVAGTEEPQLAMASQYAGY